MSLPSVLLCSRLGEPQILLILRIAFVSCNSHEVPFVIFAQVLFDLFQHDLRLWKAYSITLKVNLIHYFLDTLTLFVHLTVVFMCIFRPIHHLLNTMTCLKVWMKNFHPLQIQKRRELSGCKERPLSALLLMVKRASSEIFYFKL